MDYISDIQSTLDFIESNIQEDITLDELALLARFSKFHYHRIFLALVGCPVMEYLRKRRLTIAAGQLADTQKRIYDIAVNCGFNYQATFNRAFSKLYGVTPGEYRRNKNEITFYESVKLDECRLDTPNKSYVYGPSIIYLKERTIVGPERTATFEENIKYRVIPEFWKEFHRKIDGIGNRENEDKLFGAISYCDEKNRFNYMASAEVSSAGSVPMGMQARVIGGSKYAAFTYSGSVDTQKVYNLYKYIYGNWFVHSNYTFDNRRESIEILDNKPKTSEFTVCVPIR